jgi:hypothetical protein
MSKPLAVNDQALLRSGMYESLLLNYAEGLRDQYTGMNATLLITNAVHFNKSLCFQAIYKTYSEANNKHPYHAMLC